jgi:hypothetical protein
MNRPLKEIEFRTLDMSTPDFLRGATAIQSPSVGVAAVFVFDLLHNAVNPAIIQFPLEGCRTRSLS